MKMAISSLDVPMADGRVLRAHDTGPIPGHDGLTVLWHHGSPQTGRLYEPLLSMAGGRAIRLVSYARPSYRGSTPHRGRTVAAAAEDVAQIADALGIGLFAVMGASGGGPHALACAALLRDRVVAAVILASPAPYTDTEDWYEGMVDPGGVRAAARGREERERFAASSEFDPSSFTASDWSALDTTWERLGADAAAAGEDGPEGLIDDDLAFVRPWAFDPGSIEAPVLLVQGGEDRIIPKAHAEMLLGAIPSSELWLRPRAGHISVLDPLPVAMDWLRWRPAS